MKKLTILFLFSVGIVFSALCGGLNIVDNYSFKNKKLPIRSGTRFIILHTTEGNDQSSLASVRAKGSCNYIVLSNGQVQRIVSQNKVANHAGRSMWNGLTSISNYSIGIEIVGYHNKPITDAQERALKELLRQLKELYHISDDHVLTHSMIAYGIPNPWHHNNHRGRKRCAMQFADPNLRKELGLLSVPPYDPDVRAGRLEIGDQELFDALYSHKAYVEMKCPCVLTAGVTPWTIARDQYNDSTTIYVFPNGISMRGDQITNWAGVPVGTVVKFSDGEERNQEDFEGFREVPRDGKTAWAIAGNEYRSPTTIYFFPDKTIRRGDEVDQELLDHLPIGTKVLVGYIYGGRLSVVRSAWAVAGKKWNLPSTFYRLNSGQVVSGSIIGDSNIPDGTIILFRN